MARLQSLDSRHMAPMPRAASPVLTRRVPLCDVHNMQPLACRLVAMHRSIWSSYSTLSRLSTRCTDVHGSAHVCNQSDQHELPQFFLDGHACADFLRCSTVPTPYSTRLIRTLVFPAVRSAGVLFLADHNQDSSHPSSTHVQNGRPAAAHQCGNAAIDPHNSVDIRVVEVVVNLALLMCTCSWASLLCRHVGPGAAGRPMCS